MRIYRIDYSDDLAGNYVEWRGSKRQAERRVAEIKRRYIDAAKEKAQEAAELYDDENVGDYWKRFYHNPRPEIDLVDFPRKKADVVRWLNLWLDTNNG